MRTKTLLSVLSLSIVFATSCSSADDLYTQEEVDALVEAAVAEALANTASIETTTTSTTEPSTTTTTQPTTTTTLPPTSTTSPTTDTARLALEFFTASETLCLTHADLTGNPPPDHSRYVDVEVVEVLESDRVLIRDGLNYELIVDFATEPITIYSSEGPDAILPSDLSFGCPPELYPGTLPS